MQLPEYRKLFDVHIDSNFCAGDDFRTTAGGRVVAGGSDGTITGRGGGLAGVNRFGGCLLLDDMHKANSVSSDVQRNNVIDTYYSTIQSRGNQGWDTPQVMIGQRVHEADICDVFLTDPTWDRVIIRAIDDAGNALDPAKHTVDQLKDMEVKRPYEYYSQYQQNPQPSGGGIFKPEWFPILEHEPDIISTFITADTAETANTARDATVFSFWGLYKIIQSYSELNIYALHWLDCTEFWCEPKDLQSEFLAFYASCMRHRVKPQFAAIEKKSTGTTLVSTLNEIQGMRIIPVEHNSNSGSKITRFLNVQPFVASKLVSLPFGARHTKMCLDHVSKITAEDSARRDDITDTLQIAIQIALIDKTIINLSGVCNQKEQNNTAKMLMSKYNKMRQLRQQAFSK
jgi:predicted phage terminase large subunit-like protein